MEKYSSAGERNFSLADALALGYLEAEKANLSINILQHGQSIKTTICDLTCKGKLKSRGFGKGSGDYTLASALFEALEHFFSIAQESDSSLEIKPLDFGGYDSPLIAACPDLQSLLKGREAFFSRAEFRAINDETRRISFPIFLTNPYFESLDIRERDILAALSLKRYSTNSGTASGADCVESILHGLLETIERDAIGIELLRTVLSKNPKPTRVLDRHTFPDTLESLIQLVEGDSGGHVKVWDITSDLGVPVALAALSDGTARYFGSGASLDRAYAVERAILEALQYRHLTQLGRRLLPRGPGGSPGNSLPRYVACFLEAGFFEYKGGEKIADADFSNALRLSPRQQMDLLVDLLRTHGLTAYFRKLKANVISVSQVIVPQLERFHLVARGVPVAPGPRGRQILASI